MTFQESYPACYLEARDKECSHLGRIVQERRRQKSILMRAEAMPIMREKQAYGVLLRGAHMIKWRKQGRQRRLGPFV